MKSKAVIVVGAGHHARRVYIPELVKSRFLTDAKIVIVDLFEASPVINEYIADKKYENRVETCYLQRPDATALFSESAAAKSLLKDYDIIGVIIATDPENHMQYAEWALANNLHILMDKPISTHERLVEDPACADKLYEDYVHLIKLRKKSKSMFCLNTQRRFETGYNLVGDMVEEVAERFGMPVTSVQAFYSDGLWIFPDELLHQKVHPFNRGYGMLSHSGFHMLDIVWQLYGRGMGNGKSADKIETYSSAVYPKGMVKNFGPEAYSKVFGEFTTQHDAAYYTEKMEGFGEMDLFANFVLKKEGESVGAFTINLLHNCFSRRSWEFPAKDLYKGNGRVKHQCYIVEQGPFQCIQIHNYQSVHEHDKQDKGVDTYAMGGKNHFDICVFRNAKLFPKGEPAFRKYSSAEIDKLYAENSSRLSNEIAKSLLVDEFLDNCLAIKQGRKTRNTVKPRNCITTYEVPVKMMRAAYKSLAQTNQGLNPIVTEAI